MTGHPRIRPLRPGTRLSRPVIPRLLGCWGVVPSVLALPLLLSVAVAVATPAAATLVLRGVAAETPPRWARAAPDTLPSLDVVLRRYVDASGGRETLEGLETRVLTGREVTDLPDRGPPEEKALSAVALYPDRWSVTWTDTLVEREWSDGTRVWRTMDGDPVGSDREVRAKESFLLDPRAPLRVEAYFPGLRVVGLEERGGHTVVVVHNDLDPAYNALRFDAETGLLVQIGWYWTLEAYRECEGVMVPTRIAQSRKGGSTTWVWETVAHDVPVDPGVFAAPGG